MRIRVPSYFKDFKCISSECEDTCCAGWGIVIDEETNNYYQQVDSEFGEKLRSKIVQEDGENVFVLNGDNCSFLNENNLCEIYKELGEKNLCYVCRQYPRYMEEFLELREIGISLSCPEAARIILRNCKVSEFELSENNEVWDKDSDIDENVLEDFLLCRNIAINIIEMPNIDLEVKAAVVLKFVKEIQDKIDLGDMDEIKYVREEYSKNNFIKEIINDLYRYKGNEETKYNNVYEYFKTYIDLKHIKPNDQLGLNNVLRHFWQSEENREFYIDKHKKFNYYYKDNMYKFKNILVYFIFRYFMKAIFDYDVSAKIKIAIISLIMIKELAVVRWIENGKLTEEDMVDISHMYSKDVEHLEENIEALQEIFETEEVYEVDKILITLMNGF
ncbi:flagellin lysine-N-methylase [Clostridium weizhouense]|uniref:Flagellin lysine-N-methylase n=1 Tax=Clostridium weizhouense TaxID=2859781 RepID=A0ABS7AQS7_9CLOT|nr:flagellin lysine-N-methylase [Clostridium weizhouense]MBW6411021.1 flagellin lysine-N-methylase [Clostridium weizhouense]